MFSTGRYLEYTFVFELLKLPKPQNLPNSGRVKRPVSLLERTFSRINETVLGINRTVSYTAAEVLTQPRTLWLDRIGIGLDATSEQPVELDLENTLDRPAELYFGTC